MSQKLYALSALMAGAAAFALCLDLMPSPWGPGLAFAAAVTAGRFAEHLWPTLSDAPRPERRNRWTMIPGHIRDASKTNPIPERVNVIADTPAGLHDPQEPER